MLIEKKNFLPANILNWDGKNLKHKKYGYKIPCYRNIGKYKLFVDKTWGGNGFGSDSTYYVLDTSNSKLYTFYKDSRKKVDDLVKFLKENESLEN